MAMSGDSGPRFSKNVALAELTTMGVGGEARFFMTVDNLAALHHGVAWAEKENQPLFVLGGGSNVVFADEGFAGLVLHLQLMGFSWRDLGEKVRVRVMAGETWDTFVAHAVSQNWTGVECLSGIPGNAGAAPIQNIGAYGQELAQTLYSVEVLDRRTMSLRELRREECGFAYRDSLFKSAGAGRYIVTALTLDLTKDGPPTVRYPGLRDRLPQNPSLAQVRETVLAVRREKSMVLDPGDPNSRGCGSFFLNPVLSQTAYARFLKREPGEHPHFSIGDGRVKLAAAWLIERAGFHKGYVKGGVGLSQRHCLAIINRGGGSAREVRELAAEIQAKVRERWGMDLIPEPILL